MSTNTKWGDMSESSTEIIPSSILVAMTNGETLQFDLYRRVMGNGFCCHCVSTIAMSVNGVGFTWQSALSNAIDAAMQVINGKVVATTKKEE